MTDYQLVRLVAEKVAWGKRERELRKENRALREAAQEVLDTFSIFRSPSEETLAKLRAALANGEGK